MNLTSVGGRRWILALISGAGTFTLALLGKRTDEPFSPGMLLTFLPAVLGLVALFVFGRLLLRPMLRSVARAKSEELFVAACLLAAWWIFRTGYKIRT